MNYEEARDYLGRIYTKGKPLGLANIRVLLEELGNPQDRLKFVHIAGTNGKGSVMAYLAAILKDAGYRVGRYVSPALFSYEERIQVNGTYISKEAVARLTGRIKEARERIAAHGGPEASVFETETAMSFLYFEEEGCDLVLLETGMGGELDATNIVTTTVVEIFSSISLDHMEYLGDTLAKIATVKAGIIKPGTRVVSDAQAPEVLEVLESACQAKQATFHALKPGEITGIRYGLARQSFSYRGFEGLTILLAGTCQIQNAALAVDAALALRETGLCISGEAVRTGLANAVWEGRFQTIWEHPRVIIDGAHNPDAARVLMDAVAQYFPENKIYYIFGVFSDKEYDKIIEITARRAKKIYTVETKDNPRALPAEMLAEAVRPVNGSVEVAKEVPAALRKSLKEAGEEDVILVFGSLSFLWEARAFFESRPRGQSAEKYAEL